MGSSTTIKRSGPPSIITLLVLSVAAFAFTGCETPFSKDNDANVANYTKSGSSTGGTGLQAFQSGFYAFAVKNCAQCHGSSQAPLFAVSDVNAAYATALSIANLSNPPESPFAIYAGNGHCGVANCNGQTQTVIPLLESWAAAEANSSSSTSSSGSNVGTAAGLVPPSASIAYYTTPVAIPSTTPQAGTTFAIMRWPLSSMSPQNSLTNGGYFELQIQYLTSTMYRITSPKLAVTSATLITGVHVMLANASIPAPGMEYPLAMQWSSIAANQPATTIPNPLPKTSLNVTALSTDDMELPVVSSADQLVIGFDSLVPGSSSSTCQNLSGTNGFVSNVLPQMQSICFGCHLSGGAGYSEFPMVNNDNATLCATTLLYINEEDPDTSLIVVNPQGNNGHTNVGTSFNPTPFIEWIETE